MRKEVEGERRTVEGERSKEENVSDRYIAYTVLKRC
jgi:hypothetical protein